MSTRTHKDIIPFNNAKPLVPGSKGGGLRYWRQEREKQALNDEIAEMALVLRRMAQELVEQILFVRDPLPKTIEARQRAISRMAGALKKVSPLLMELFPIADIHPCFDPILAEKQKNRLELSEADIAEMPALNPKAGLPVRFQDLPTDGQFEVLAYKLAGYRTFEIANALGVSHRAVSLQLLKVRNIAAEMIGRKERANEPK